MAAPRGHVWFKFDRPLALRSFLGRAWQHSAIGMRLLFFLMLRALEKYFETKLNEKGWPENGPCILAFSQCIRSSGSFLGPRGGPTFARCAATHDFFRSEHMRQVARRDSKLLRNSADEMK